MDFYFPALRDKFQGKLYCVLPAVLSGKSLRNGHMDSRLLRSKGALSGNIFSFIHYYQIGRYHSCGKCESVEFISATALPEKCSRSQFTYTRRVLLAFWYRFCTSVITSSSFTSTLKLWDIIRIIVVRNRVV